MMAISAIQGGYCSRFPLILQTFYGLSHDVRDYAKKGSYGSSFFLNGRFKYFGYVLILCQSSLIVGLNIGYIQGGAYTSALSLVQTYFSLEGCEEDYELGDGCLRVQILTLRMLAYANSHSTYTSAYCRSVCLSIYILPSLEAYYYYVYLQIDQILGLSKSRTSQGLLNRLFYLNGNALRSLNSIYRGCLYAVYLRSISSLGARNLQRNGSHLVTLNDYSNYGSSSYVTKY